MGSFFGDWLGACSDVIRIGGATSPVCCHVNRKRFSKLIKGDRWIKGGIRRAFVRCVFACESTDLPQCTPQTVCHCSLMSVSVAPFDGFSKMS